MCIDDNKINGHRWLLVQWAYMTISSMGIDDNKTNVYRWLLDQCA